MMNRSLWHAAWKRAKQSDCDCYERAIRGDPDFSVLGTKHMILQSLMSALRAGEVRCSGLLHEDALEAEPVPPRWWEKMALISEDRAKGGGREVTALRILDDVITAGPSEPADVPRGPTEHSRKNAGPGEPLRAYLASLHPSHKIPSDRACWRVLNGSMPRRLMRKMLAHLRTGRGFGP